MLQSWHQFFKEIEMEGREPRATGGRLLQGTEWLGGKTAASRRFVREAGGYIETCTNESEIERLEQAIDSIKNGTLVLNEWLTVQEFLNKGATT